jgi:hypothetical protein
MKIRIEKLNYKKAFNEFIICRRKNINYKKKIIIY